MKNTDDKIDHSGHRTRLTELVARVGIENVSKVQAVEFFLTYIIPRVDVNPLAHRLLERYENFSNIINADPNDLAQVKGISLQSANKIHLFGSLFEYYISSKLSEKINLENNAKFLDFLEDLLRYQSTENLYMLGIDHGFNLVSQRKFGMDMVRSVGISPMEIYGFIASSHPSYLIFAHNHPAGTAIASPQDHDAAQYIQQLLENFECKLFDSFIVGEDGIFSEQHNGFVRRFEQNENII